MRQQQSESASIFGAFCPAQDSASGVVLPHANTAAMIHQLQASSAAVPAGRHAVLVLDRAGMAHQPETAAIGQCVAIAVTGGVTRTQSRRTGMAASARLAFG